MWHKMSADDALQDVIRGEKQYGRLTLSISRLLCLYFDGIAARLLSQGLFLFPGFFSLLDFLGQPLQTLVQVPFLFLQCANL